VRVVVLSKDHRLTAYLEQRLAQAGCLAGVLHEVRLRNRRELWNYGRRSIRRDGLLRTADAYAYELWDRAFRRGEFARLADEVVPLEAVPGADAIPRISVTSLNSAEAREAIARLAPDILVVHATGILKPATYEVARLAAINIHCGVLPEYRGHASTFWSLSRGDYGNIGVTLHLVAPTVDTGALVRLGRVTPTAGDNDISLWFRAFRLGVDLLLDSVREAQASGSLSTGRYEGAFGPHYPRKGLTDYLGWRLRTLTGSGAPAFGARADA
jgi:hypothetical protein